MSTKEFVEGAGIAGLRLIDEFVIGLVHARGIGSVASTQGAGDTLISAMLPR